MDNESKERCFFSEVRRGEVYLADLGKPDGFSVQKGVRPVVIVDNKIACKKSPVVSVVSCTTNLHEDKNLPMNYIITKGKYDFLWKTGACQCERSIPIDKKQLLFYFGRLEMSDLEEIVDRLVVGYRTNNYN